MYSSSSFQTSVQEIATTSLATSTQFMENNAPFEYLSLFNTDTLSVSTDSLSPRSHSSLSGDEECCPGKRRRSYNNFTLSPKRFKDASLYRDEVMPPHSPESGIALSPPMTVYSQNPSCGKVWIDILEQPEEYYRARYASEGSRGPLKGRSHNSYPKVKLMMEGSNDHISATITVNLVHDDNTLHSVCSLATLEEEGSSNLVKRVTTPDFIVEFEQLRVKRERHTGGSKGKQKAKPQKQNESVGYLLFQAEVTTIDGSFTCQKRSHAIKLTSKPESAELHAIKNNYGSVEGGEEVWIRGSKMIGNPSVYFEIYDLHSGKCVKRHAGSVMREESHQNLLVVKTPRVPYNEQVVAYVVVVTGKDKMKSNALPFTFIPTGAPSVTEGMFYQKPSKSPMEPCVLPPPYSRLSPCYSPQPSTPSSVGCFTTDDDLPFLPSTPPANALEGLLDMCAQQLDKTAEEKILQTAALPADSSSLAVQDLDEKQLQTVIQSGSPLHIHELDNTENNNAPPPTILLPAEAAVSLAVNLTLRN